MEDRTMDEANPENEQIEKPTEEANEEEDTKSAVSPLEAAARRLERLLSDTDVYTNPVKLVRKWLGSASSASSKVGMVEIQAAAYDLLDPMTCKGRALLVEGYETEGLAMETDDPASPPQYVEVASRQVECWLISLAVRVLWQKKEPRFLAVARQMATQGIALAEEDDAGAAAALPSSMFPLLARLYRWQALVVETMDGGASSCNQQQEMAQAFHRATLRRDVDCQANLLNGMLRALLNQSQVEQAQKLLANSTFPETASNNQWCRYLYYSGRVQALRLEYTASFSSLSQCLRKAPMCATGFRIASQRLLICVQLLMGEVPDRHVFFQTGIKTELEPYLHMTQAVRKGDLSHFQTVLATHQPRLRADRTATLMARLAHQVVKAGLRKLHLSYSRLSLQDVADRLGLPNARSAEAVVAKAVRDGVLDATIHHELQYVQSHDMVDVYQSPEPANAFHRRIAFLLTTHNDAVRGLRYPPDAYKKQLEAARGGSRRGRKDKSDEEKAKELEDELDDGDY